MGIQKIRQTPVRLIHCLVPSSSSRRTKQLWD